MADAADAQPLMDRDVVMGRKVVVVGSARIPFCRSYGAYAGQNNLTLMGGALAGLVGKFALKGQKIDEVVGGAVLNHSRDFNLAREAALDAGLSPNTPGTTMQMACGTSLQAALMIAAKIASGEIESGIAVGSDTISDAPIVFGDKFAHRLIKLSRARALGQRFGVFKGFSFGEIKPVAPSVNEPRTGLSMGQHCERMARTWEIERAEQDEFALKSHINAAKSYEAGFHDDLVVPFAGIVRDDNVRADSSLEKMADMKPAFDKRSGFGSLTAANSTPLTDGASSVLLASEDWARARGLPILAYLRSGAVGAVNFAAGDGLLMAPTLAVSDLLNRLDMRFKDIDLFEVHEAFAAQVLCTLKAWSDRKYCREVLGRSRVLGKIPPAKINIKGSSLAYGHPFAATGGRILGHTAKLLHETGKKNALISVCTAGGMGVAALLERAEEA